MADEDFREPSAHARRARDAGRGVGRGGAGRTDLQGLRDPELAFGEETVRAAVRIHEAGAVPGVLQSPDMTKLMGNVARVLDGVRMNVDGSAENVPIIPNRTGSTSTSARLDLGGIQRNLHLDGTDERLLRTGHMEVVAEGRGDVGDAIGEIREVLVGPAVPDGDNRNRLPDRRERRHPVVVVRVAEQELHDLVLRPAPLGDGAQVNVLNGRGSNRLHSRANIAARSGNLDETSRNVHRELRNGVAVRGGDDRGSARGRGRAGRVLLRSARGTARSGDRNGRRRDSARSPATGESQREEKDERLRQALHGAPPAQGSPLSQRREFFSVVEPGSLG